MHAALSLIVSTGSLLVAIFFAPPATQVEDKPSKIEYVKHDGHFERNDSGLKGPKSFLAFRKLDTFEGTFGVAALGLGPTKKQKFVTPETFEDRLVLAAIYRGTSEPTISDIRVQSQNGIISVKYKLKPGRDAGFAMNVPLILSIPKTKFEKIEFYENDKLQATLNATDIEDMKIIRCGVPTDQ